MNVSDWTSFEPVSVEMFNHFYFETCILSLKITQLYKYKHPRRQIMYLKNKQHKNPLEFSGIFYTGSEFPQRKIVAEIFFTRVQFCHEKVIGWTFDK